MPNWCYNRITVYGDSDTTDKIKEVEKIFESKTPFNDIFPMPDFKTIPNEKGELPKLEQMKTQMVRYYGKPITSQMVKMMIDGIIGALRTGIPSGAFRYARNRIRRRRNSSNYI